MRFAHVTISVKDMEESLRFYRDIVGLPVTRKFPAGPGRDIVFLGFEGGTEIELISGAQGALSFGQDISIGFEVESLEQMIRSLRDNKVEVGETQSPNPSVKMTFVSDPNGVRVQFLEYVK